MLQKSPPKQRIATTETRYGKMSYYTGDMYIGRSLEFYGEYSPGEIELCAKFVRPDWNIVNGGANIGAIAVPLAGLVPEGKVFAFEPQPEARKLLRRNVASHSNIEVSDCALWHSRGDSKIRLYMELGHDNYGCTSIGGGSAHVRMIALDDWLEGQNVNLMFLDIEGCEIMALEGAKETIKRCRPLLYLENHPDIKDEKGFMIDLAGYVRKMGYFCYRHKVEMYSADNWKKCPENVFATVKNLELKSYICLSYNILAVPKERIDEFRHVVEDQTKFYREKQGTRLQMLLPPQQVAKEWAAIVRCGGVGDNLIAASVCKPLKEMGYKVEVITQTPHGLLFENNPHVDKISVYDEKDWPKELDRWQEWFRMRSKEYDKFANFGHSCECRHALFPIQTSFWWPQEYRRKICGGSYLETVHDIVGVPYSFGPLFWPTDEEREQALVTRHKLGAGPIIAWCLSGTRIDKVYPYAPLIVGRLIKELGATVVLMGAPSVRDIETSKIIMESVKAQNGSLDGLVHASSPSITEQTWPIRRILSMAQVCDLYIGGDTGPSWGVAFEALPKIIMVSHASVENITKHWINTITLHADPTRVPCWPCHRLHSTFETCNPTKVNDGDFAACISDINGETIIQEAMKCLKTTKGPTSRKEPSVAVQVEWPSTTVRSG